MRDRYIVHSRTGEAIDLVVGEVTALPQGFFITAHNPYSIVCPTSVNDVYDGLLTAALNTDPQVQYKIGASYVPSDGVPEIAWYVVSNYSDLAARYMRQFNQSAVIVVDCLNKVSLLIA